MTVDPEDVQVYFSNLVVFFGTYEFIFAICDLFVNTFHVYILSRRHMRTSSINSILLGIALVDMVFPLVAIKKSVRVWIFGSGNCYNYISQSRFGWQIVIFVICLSTILSFFYYLRYEIVPNGAYWQPDISCPGHTNGVSKSIFIYHETWLFTFSDGLVRKLYMLIVGILAKFLPCCLLPIFTIILIRELGKAKKAREKAKKEGRKNDLTTLLVIYMTISIFTIEFPIGICFWIEGLSSATVYGKIATSIIQLLNMVYVVMTLTHFAICFLISTQYRRTVKRVFSSSSEEARLAGGTAFSVVHSPNQLHKSTTDSGHN